MAVRFGVSPIAWTNDDLPELGGETPLATMLADAQQIGFAGVELGGKFPRQAAALQPLLRDHGLELVGGWYSGALLTRSPQAEIAALREHLALLEAMGSNVFIFAETSNAIHGTRNCSLSASPKLDAAGWARFGAGLGEVAGHIERRGLSFAYHHHLGTVVENSTDLELFLRSTPDCVGLTLDTGHAALAGIDPIEIIRKYPKRIAHVHCKDVRLAVFERLVKSGGSFLDGVLAGMFTVPGDGSLDFRAILAALADIRYSGWIIVEAEQDPAVAAPRVYSALGLATLRRAAIAAGMTEAVNP